MTKHVNPIILPTKMVTMTWKGAGQVHACVVHFPEHRRGNNRACAHDVLVQCPKVCRHKYTNICTCKEMRQKKQSNQNRKIIYLEILKRRLEAKTNDHGLRVFSCEILPVGVILMGRTTPNPSELRPEEARQALKAKRSFHGRLSFWKRKFNQTQ